MLSKNTVNSSLTLWLVWLNWLIIRLRTKWLLVRVPLVWVYELSGCWFESRCSHLHFRTIECGFNLKLARDMIRMYNQVKNFFNPANTQCSFKESFKKKRKALTGICSLSSWFSKQILNLCHNIGLFKTLSII